MFKNLEGQTIPNVTFKILKNDRLTDITTDELFKDKKIVFFALPGAFTPTCSSSHLPRYNQLAQTFKQNGIDNIICLAVNDAFVMKAWQDQQEAQNITMIADGNGEFTEQMGLLVDKSNIGFGKRSWRYSMYVENKVIKKMFIEPMEDGDPYKVSDADTMLKYLAPNTQPPKSVTILSKPRCPYCRKAKKLLDEKNIQYEEIIIGKDATTVTVRAISGRSTVPQIFVEGKHIGGYDDLVNYFKNHETL